MDANKTTTSPAPPKVLKETKNKIRVDFERTSKWTKFKLKYLSGSFAFNVIWKLARFLLLLGISYVIISPFITKIFSSFMSADDFVDVTVKMIPKYPTIDTYKAIIRDNHYFLALFNTLILSVVCALIQTFVCAIIGYGFAKFKFKGNGLLFALVILTMIIPHRTLQFSMFMKFRYFNIIWLTKTLFAVKLLPDINLINTLYPLILLSLTGLGFKNGLYIFMMRQFFRGVPDELEESAYLDGYGVFKTFFKIIIPLSIPMMITVFLFSFSWQWTDNFYTKLFFTTAKITLLPSIVTPPKSLDISIAKTMFTGAISNACALLIIAPLIIIFLFCQKFMVQGIERSGIVG
ncbi:MAG: carbohydrate ABC transporter permease [Clostridia bacterium]|nr:carbohydrate ABC transporter permease [Clostridia bacterium]